MINGSSFNHVKKNKYIFIELCVLRRRRKSIKKNVYVCYQKYQNEFRKRNK